MKQGIRRNLTRATYCPQARRAVGVCSQQRKAAELQGSIGFAEQTGRSRKPQGTAPGRSEALKVREKKKETEIFRVYRRSSRRGTAGKRV